MKMSHEELAEMVSRFKGRVTVFAPQDEPTPEARRSGYSNRRELTPAGAVAGMRQVLDPSCYATGSWLIPRS